MIQMLHLQVSRHQSGQLWRAEDRQLRELSEQIKEAR